MSRPEEHAPLPEPAKLPEGQPAAAGDASPDHGPSAPWKDRLGLVTVAVCLVIAATSWYLLKELAPLLRPLLLAVFLGYVILPGHRRLSQRIAATAATIVMAGGSVALLVLLTWLILGSAAQLNEEMPRFIKRAETILREAESYVTAHLPPWLAVEAGEVVQGQSQLADRLKELAGSLAGAAADIFTEAVLVGIYLIFLLVEAGRVPQRIQSAFTGEQPDQILTVVRNINEAMAGYLHVKVKASLLLAIPAVVLLWAFGIKFALMWGVLTFLLNFIPYLGSIIACSGPILLAFLQMESFGQPAVAAVLLIGIHASSAYLIEPALTGRAVGLSPLVILVTLAFWGLCWGLPGMILAVPLTVMVKIILENVAFTRPFARLLGEE
jgi:AI-2 transport protein TqsA